jgi:hypothetical protein
MSVLLMTLAGSSTAAATTVDLGTAGSFGVLAGESVTNTGPSVISGDLGVHPGNAVSGFPPGTILGSLHTADALAAQAKSDLTVAYNAVAGQSSDELITDDLGGRTLTTGVYTASSTMALTGQLTLDAQGDPFAVFVFQVGSGLTTASGSNVTLTNGAAACNVFWQVGSSATLGTASTFRGTILAQASITATTGTTIEGRLLARTGSVTLDDNTITQPVCATPSSDVPSSDVPGTDLPGTDLPGTDLPGTDVPGSDAPALEQPKVPTEKQVGHLPKDFPNTGDGGSMSDSGRGLIAGGILILLISGMLLIWWRRGTSTD